MTLPEVVEIFQESLCMPDPSPLLTVLGAIAGNKFEGPPAISMFLTGPSSSGKNEILEAILGVHGMRHYSTITAGAFLSGTSRRDTDKGSKGGILMEIGVGGVGTIVLTEFNSMLSMSPVDRLRSFGIIRDICTGFVDRGIGVDGARSIHWHGKVAFLANCTDIIESHRAAISEMGDRFISCHMPAIDRKGHLEASKRTAVNGGIPHMRDANREAVSGLFAGLAIPSKPKLTATIIESIGCIADFTSLARTGQSWDNHRREIDHVLGAEGPGRLFHMFYRLAAGMQLIGIPEQQTMRLLSAVGLECIPDLKREIVRYVGRALMEDSSVTVSELKRAAAVDRGRGLQHFGDSTVRRAMQELEISGVLARQAVGVGMQEYWSFTETAVESFYGGFSVEAL